METTETDAPEVLETPEEATEETPEQLKARIAELEGKVSTTEAEKAELDKKNKQLFERVKKQEGKPEGLSPADIIALRDLHEDDVEPVQEWAKFKGISFAEARKDSVMQTILKTNEETRRTAAATHTSGGSRSVTKTSGADLLAKALATNELPDTDEGMAAIAEARLNSQRRKAK